MRGVVACARASLRRRWRAWVGFGVLVGLAGGLVTSIAVGARRTESSYRRFLAVSNPSDVLLLDSNDYGFTGRVDLDEIAELPQVAASVRARPVFFPTGTVNGRTVSFLDFLPVISLGGDLGTTMDRQHILEGRAADPTRADEAVLGFPAAAALDIEVGAVVDMVLVGQDDFLPLVGDFLDKLEARVAGEDRTTSLGSFEHEIRTAIRRQVTIVGIEAAPGEFPPLAGDNPSLLHLTPAFGREVGPDVVHQDNLFVRLRPGAGVAEFKAAAERVAGEQTVPFLYTRQDQQQDVQRLLDVQATLLWALAALVAVSGGIVLAQLISRQSAAEAMDSEALAALGFTRSQRTATATGRALVEGGVAGAVTLVVGVAASGVWSFGTARVAEVDPGPHLDGSALVVGGLVTTALVGGVVFLTAWRAALRVRASVVARRAPGLGLTASRLVGARSFGLGVRLASDPGRGRRSVPVRSCVLALGATVAAVAMLASFLASLDHLVGRPAAYGWTWDSRFGVVGIPDVSEPLLGGLRRNPAVDGVSLGTVSQLLVDGERVGAYAVDQEVGDIEPALLEGRTPRGPREVALGTLTLRAVGTSVGDDVRVAIGGREASFRVVGRAVLPDIGDRGQLGTGAWLTFEGLQRLVRAPVRNIALVRFAPGVDGGDATGRLRRAVAPFPVAEPEPPADLTTMQEASDLGGVVLALLAGLAAATLLHALLVSRRRRSRELGTLRALGLRPRQVLGLFVGAGGALALVAVGLGLVVGAIGGRVMWTLMADTLGVPAAAVVPFGALGVFAAASLGGAAVLACVPGWLAARRRPAVSLRAE